MLWVKERNRMNKQLRSRVKQINSRFMLVETNKFRQILSKNLTNCTTKTAKQVKLI
jgi:hypothetical protein